MSQTYSKNITTAIDYNTFSLSELQREEKKLNRKRIVSSFLIGFPFGIILYTIVMNSYNIWAILISLFLIRAFYKSAVSANDQWKIVQAEIMLRE